MNDLQKFLEVNNELLGNLSKILDVAQTQQSALLSILGDTAKFHDEIKNYNYTPLDKARGEIAVGLPSTSIKLEVRNEDEEHEKLTREEEMEDNL